MKNKIYKIILIIFLIIIIMIILGGLLLKKLVNINLNGEDIVNVSYNSKYDDSGAKATFLKKNLTSRIKISDNINYEKIGTYYIEYQIKYFGVNKKVKRTINITDEEKPIITLKGNNPLSLTINTEYKEPGYNVSDNYDANPNVIVTGLDKLDVKRKGEYIIEYKVTDSSNNYAIAERKIIIKEPVVVKETNTVKTGPTYINGILLVNKKYSLPKNFGNGNDKEALSQLRILQSDAKKVGFTISLVSSYRSYDYQKTLYNNYVKKHGQAKADTFSARPGHSEHQTGLAFDVGKIDDNYGNTDSGKWLASNAHLYGFIIRYPKGKEKITGYKYEPWHIRYLGVDIATKVYQSGLCLEEYLKV